MLIIFLQASPRLPLSIQEEITSLSGAWAQPKKLTRGPVNMRIAALILGIIGGIIGLFAAGAAIAIGGVGTAVGANQAGMVVSLGFAAIGLSVLGIVGAALALAKPKLAGVLMIIAGIGGFIAVSIAYIVAGPLLLIGGLFALLARGRPRSVSNRLEFRG